MRQCNTTDVNKLNYNINDDEEICAWNDTVNGKIEEEENEGEQDHTNSLNVEAFRIAKAVANNTTFQ